MSKVSDILTGKRRKTDRAQAQRILGARREMDKSYHAPGPPGRETNSGVERARAVWERADANGSPRAKKRADRQYARYSEDRARTERRQRQGRSPR